MTWVAAANLHADELLEDWEIEYEMMQNTTNVNK